MKNIPSDRKCSHKKHKIYLNLTTDKNVYFTAVELTDTSSLAVPKKDGFNDDISSVAATNDLLMDDILSEIQTPDGNEIETHESLQISNIEGENENYSEIENKEIEHNAEDCEQPQQMLCEIIEKSASNEFITKGGSDESVEVFEKMRSIDVDDIIDVDLIIIDTDFGNDIVVTLEGDEIIENFNE